MVQVKSTGGTHGQLGQPAVRTAAGDEACVLWPWPGADLLVCVVVAFGKLSCGARGRQGLTGQQRTRLGGMAGLRGGAFFKSH